MVLSHRQRYIFTNIHIQTHTHTPCSHSYSCQEKKKRRGASVNAEAQDTQKAANIPAVINACWHVGAKRAAMGNVWHCVWSISCGAKWCIGAKQQSIQCCGKVGGICLNAVIFFFCVSIYLEFQTFFCKHFVCCCLFWNTRTCVKWVLFQTFAQYCTFPEK